MDASSDPWMKDYNEAVKLADDINIMIPDRGSMPTSGPETHRRHGSAIRRKLIILSARLDSLQNLLSRPTGKPLSEKEMNRRKDMLTNMTLNMSNIANRDSLLVPEINPTDVMSRTTSLDNYGLVGLQRQVMKEQDEDLEKLVQTVTSTNHIALAVNEELNLYNRLVYNLDEHGDVTESRLRQVEKTLAVFPKPTSSVDAPARCCYSGLLELSF